MIFGADCSDNNALNIKRLAEINYDFLVMRRTGGLDGRGGVWIDSKFHDFNRTIKSTDLIPGDYAFPVNPDFVDIETQVDRFLNLTTDDFDGRMVMVDYELYAPNPEATIKPAGLKAYIRELRKQGLGKDHPIFLYANRNFWQQPPSSGKITDYGPRIVPWNAWYWTADAVPSPREYYYVHLNDSGYWERWHDGMREPVISQYAIGIAAGIPLDINAFKGTRDDLLRYTVGVSDEPDEPDDPPVPDDDQLPEWVTGPRDYLLACVGGPYVPWISGPFMAGPPAWVKDAPPPNPEIVANEGAFCAASHNLAQRYNRVFPVDSANWWYGGLAWMGERYTRAGVARPFRTGQVYPTMSLFVKRYQGQQLALQGHTWVKVGYDRMMSWDRQFGGNARRTLRDTVGLSGGCDFWVHPDDWLKPKKAARIGAPVRVRSSANPSASNNMLEEAHEYIRAVAQRPESHHRSVVPTTAPVTSRNRRKEVHDTVRNEPVITANTIATLVAAILTLLVQFGLEMTGGQIQAVLSLVTIIAPFIVATIYARARVTPIHRHNRARGGD